jgi:UDP-2-acetamido-3-amino-2,3-dideoxy-glucuronate N-acetyltransferase
VHATALRGVRVHQLPAFRDARGTLTCGQVNSPLPFAPLRYFVIANVPADAVRGRHAHRRCHQFVTCVSGSCTLTVDDGLSRDAIALHDSTTGVHLEPRVWTTIENCSPDAVILVLCSDAYQVEDYITDYAELQRLTDGT